MRRPRLLALIVIGVVAFLVISALLARALSADGAERSAVTTLVQAEARGDIASAQAQVENGTRMGQRLAQLPGVHLEGQRLLATAVDDSGHETLAPQSARRARAGGLAAGYFQGC